jgi:hypothetical protein
VAGGLLDERKDNHDAKNHQVDYADSVINRNQRNQSMSATTLGSDDVGHSSPKRIDYTDYGGGVDYVDYTDYAHESVAAY